MFSVSLVWKIYPQPGKATLTYYDLWKPRVEKNVTFIEYKFFATTIFLRAFVQSNVEVRSYEALQYSM